MSGGGAAYLADRKTPGNPHPGTDSILRLSSADLAAAGVRDGDLLVATEGGATMIALRCAFTCTVIPVVSTPTTAHGEGHVVFTHNTAPGPPSAIQKATRARSATPASGSNALIAILVVVVLLAFAGGIILGRRRT
jgi:hypothetical protein